MVKNVSQSVAQKVNVNVHIGDKKRKRAYKRRPKRSGGGGGGTSTVQPARIYNPVYIQSGGFDQLQPAPQAPPVHSNALLNSARAPEKPQPAPISQTHSTVPNSKAFGAFAHTPVAAPKRQNMQDILNMSDTLIGHFAAKDKLHQQKDDDENADIIHDLNQSAMKRDERRQRMNDRVLFRQEAEPTSFHDVLRIDGRRGPRTDAQKAKANATRAANRASLMQQNNEFESGDY